MSKKAEAYAISWSLHLTTFMIFNLHTALTGVQMSFVLYASQVQTPGFATNIRTTAIVFLLFFLSACVTFAVGFLFDLDVRARGRIAYRTTTMIRSHILVGLQAALVFAYPNRTANFMVSFPIGATIIIINFFFGFFPFLDRNPAGLIPRNDLAFDMTATLSSVSTACRFLEVLVGRPTEERLDRIAEILDIIKDGTQEKEERAPVALYPYRYAEGVSPFAGTGNKMY
ncbi:hypothetical protein V5O48_014843 [Marasmius crinis-equi]|uniref:Uncharacterized protein n=1 Tax=Marasmius crinis-equi TaxID=585013 RepID=A0ABR3EW43_9AGAR